MTYQEKLLDFLKNEKKITEINADTDLFGSGYVNSLFALEMVLFLEKNFDIKIPRKEMNKANFMSINAMATLVERLKK